ncbi:hypothetical protein THAOC_15071 [Thalassiosira oceanica]|uniref:6-phosphofructo-2-kinase domain-containing protein n=1 Tax=Thalassiosira oceanica TaxID=159749 RepID=K0SFY3_THAOC|nr:hypothetical protein THAOC_15071 [Thalassiosira oceanica]|eukprot:EJK64215.1 hypothetical protein THAOC_15071 [Thalassiosira oceanica]
MSGSDQPGSGGEKPATDSYYAKGSAELATESALTLLKIQHRLRLTKRSDRLVIVLVGLPGRGKSFVARKLQNFLTWRGTECKVFNVGKYRREVAIGSCDSNFFDSKNEAAIEARQKAASLAMEDMLRWLDNNEGSGTATPSSGALRKAKDRIGIFDATNSTKSRRNWILEQCTCRVKRAGKPIGVVFVESICDDKDLLRANYLTKVNNSPDYDGMTSEEALADIEERCRKYEETYETLDEDSQSYIKIFNLSSKILLNHIYGRMAKSIVPALMAWNIGTRPVFICRAGMTMNDNERSMLNLGMSRSENLGEHGRTFRDKLFNFMKDECLGFMSRRRKAAFSPDMNTGTSISGTMNRGFGSSSDLAAFLKDEDSDEETSILNSEHVEEEYIGCDGVTPLPFPCYIMSSTMPRARQTVEWEDLPYDVHMLSNLNPLDKGDFTGRELEDIGEEHPDWYTQLVSDPFYTRFPGGECYGDLTSRLESVVVDIEQQVGPVLVVSHVSVLQVMVAYFRDTPVENCTSIALPMNTVLKFTPAKGGSWQESQHCLMPSTHGSQSKLCQLSDMHPPDHTCDTPMMQSPNGHGPMVKLEMSKKFSNSPPSALARGLTPPPIWGDHRVISVSDHHAQSENADADRGLSRRGATEGRNTPAMTCRDEVTIRDSGIVS